MKKFLLNLKTKKLSKRMKFLLFLLPFFLLSFTILKCFDNDAWFMFNHGRYVLEHGFPTIEPFTIHENFRFVMQQWLFAVLLYSIYRAFGAIGIYFLIIFLNILLLFMLYRLCMLVSDKNYVVSIIISVFIDCLLLYFGYITSRPQLFTYFFLLLFVYLTELFMRKGDKKVLFWMPLISLLQINMHASMWWFLFLFVLPFLCEMFIETFFFKKKLVYDVRWYLIILCICFIVGFINSYGIDGMTYFFASLHPTGSLLVDEMKPIKILSVYGIIIMLLFFVQFLFYGHFKEKRRICYTLLLFGSFLLALCNRKSCVFFLLFGVYYIAHYLKDYKKDATIISFPHQKVFVYLLSFLLILGIGVSFYKPTQEPRKNYFEGAVDKVLQDYEASSIRAYVHYNFGGYTEYRGIPSYLDPRAEVFYYSMNHQDDVIAEFYDLQNGMVDVEEFLNKYQFTHLFITQFDYLSTLKTIPHYVPYYEDSFVSIYVREDIIK